VDKESTPTMHDIVI